MALNTLKCDYLRPLHFKGLIEYSICKKSNFSSARRFPIRNTFARILLFRCKNSNWCWGSCNVCR